MQNKLLKEYFTPQELKQMGVDPFAMGNVSSFQRKQTIAPPTAKPKNLSSLVLDYAEQSPTALRVSGGDPLKNFINFAADYVPGLSLEKAKREQDALGQKLALLDLIPGGGLLAKKAITGAKKGISDEVVDTSYRMDHQPRGREFDDAIQLDNLSKDISGNRGGYPEDFYTPRGQKIYAPGPRFADDEFGIANEQSYKQILKARGKPDAEVTIYRAVPKGIKKINEGDFVTLSPKYAELHSIDQLDYRPPESPRGDVSGDVISQKVKVKDLIWDGNDVNEFGYFPIK